MDSSSSSYLLVIIIVGLAWHMYSSSSYSSFSPGRFPLLPEQLEEGFLGHQHLFLLVYHGNLPLPLPPHPPRASVSTNSSLHFVWKYFNFILAKSEYICEQKKCGCVVFWRWVNSFLLMGVEKKAYIWGSGLRWFNMWKIFEFLILETKAFF